MDFLGKGPGELDAKVGAACGYDVGEDGGEGEIRKGDFVENGSNYGERRLGLGGRVYVGK